MSKHWQKVVAEGRSLEVRLQRFSQAQVVSFAAGCAQHIFDHFVSLYKVEGVSNDAVSAFVRAIENGLATSWAGQAGTGDAQAVNTAISAIDRLLEEEQLLEGATDTGAHNIDQIAASVYKTLQCLRDSSHTGYAIGAAHCAYGAILQWYVMGMGDTVAWSEEESFKQEGECEACCTEIDFQMKYLAAVETLGRDAGAYSQVIERMGRA